MVTDCHLPVRDLESTASCPRALPGDVKVTAALYFQATVIKTSSAIGGIVQSAVNSAIHAVTSSLVCHARHFITFPVTADSQSGKTTIQD